VENCHQSPGNCGSTKQLSGQGKVIIHKLALSSQVKSMNRESQTVNRKLSSVARVSSEARDPKLRGETPSNHLFTHHDSRFTLFQLRVDEAIVAGWTNAVAELDFRAFADVAVNLLPIILIVADFLAIGTNRH
jgi:hypothetical protein